MNLAKNGDDFHVVLKQALYHATTSGVKQRSSTTLNSMTMDTAVMMMMMMVMMMTVLMIQTGITQNPLALIHIHRDMPVDLDEVVKLFASMHPRKWS